MPSGHRFDHAEARRRVADGGSFRAVARELGVSPVAVFFAVNPEKRRKPRRTPVGTWPHEWCPPHLRDDYRTLRGCKVPAAEARRMIEAHAARQGAARV